MVGRRLGKGLDALIPQLELEDDETVLTVAVEDLRANPYQPRKHFSEDALKELAESIQEHGIVQPLVVRKTIKGYEIVAGERRLRAAKRVNMKVVPVVVKDFTDKQVMEIALIENLQREDLNPIEVADAYQKLMDEFSMTQEELAARVGKSRPHIANFLRLLHLPAAIRQDVSRGTLSMGHARALLAIKNVDEQISLAKKVKEEAASVRQLEEWISRLQNKKSPAKSSAKANVRDLVFKRYEEELRTTLGTAVRIQQGRRNGKIEIDYFSRRDLERLVHLLVDRD